MTEAQLARFWPKVREAGECWLWTGYRNPRGYGHFMIQKRPRQAHRVSYEHFRESIPPGMQIDHLCRVPQCVNPWHLEVVTPAVNAARSYWSPESRKRHSQWLTTRPVSEDTRANISIGHARRTHCIHGHEFTPDNTYFKPTTQVARGWVRQCRTCTRMSIARFREKRKQEMN